MASAGIRERSILRFFTTDKICYEMRFHSTNNFN